MEPCSKRPPAAQGAHQSHWPSLPARFGALGGFGALVPLSWYVVIRSYRQLNSGKFLALHELE